MRRRVFAALAAAMLLLSASAAAEEWTRGYGGSGSDRLDELAAYEDGLIAVGRTSSSDGDLEMRTRYNQAGWMLRLDGEGNPLWSFCTAKNGRNQMGGVYVHENGLISAILWGWDVPKSEWLVINGQGKLVRRMEVPAVEAACAHSGQGVSGIAYDRGGLPHLALCVEHGDGTICLADMDMDGQIACGLSFVDGPNSRIEPCADGSGCVALGYCDREEAGVLIVKPGTDDVPQKLEVEGVASDCGTMLLPLEDGSVILGGQKVNVGGFLARVNALGETMFTVETDDLPEGLALTPEGFACVVADQLYYFDEDGNLLGKKKIAYLQERSKRPLMDITPMGDGTAMAMDAENFGGNRAEIVFVPGEGIEVPDDEYDKALYHAFDCVLKDAWPQENGVLILLERGDGQRVGVSVDANGEARETTAPEPREANRQAVSGGTLSWKEEPGGAVVTLEDEQGNEIWHVRTMIHTAADRLEWFCAMELPDGSYALGGRYLTGESVVKEQAATMAIIGREGVLRQIVPVETKARDQTIGCVRDMAYDPQRGVLLLTARSEYTDGGVCDIQTPDGSYDVFVPIGLGIEEARLTLDASGNAYICGTDRDNGQNITAVIRVNLETKEATFQR